MKIIEMVKDNRFWKATQYSKGYTLSYGVIGGKVTERNVKVKPKNIGKANETTLEQQTWFEMVSAAKSKIDEHYLLLNPEQVKGETGFNRDTRPTILPMLAKEYKEGVKLPDKFYIQPKLDGFRCIARRVDNEVVLTTRKGKVIDTLHEITDELTCFFTDNPDMILDGEVYLHNVGFNTLASMIKKRQERTCELEYHVFDLVLSINYETRNSMLNGFLKPSKHIKIVPTCNIGVDELKAKHDLFIEQGYEGSILRVRNCIYQQDKRSGDLLKYKNMCDAEYVIVGGKPELMQDGREGVVYEVQDINNEGITFSVRPKADMNTRHKAWLNLNNDIGRLYTVQFQELSVDMIPRFPVGLRFKEEV